LADSAALLSRAAAADREILRLMEDEMEHVMADMIFIGVEMFLLGVIVGVFVWGIKS
jgi:hypothetical protein